MRGAGSRGVSSTPLGSARVSRVGFGVATKQAFARGAALASGIVEKSAIAKRNRQHAGRVRYPDSFEQIRAVFPRAPQRFFLSPLFDLRVISGK